MSYEYTDRIGQIISEGIQKKYPGMSYTAFALKYGIPKATFFKIVQGKCKSPNFWLLKEIAEKLDLSLDDMLL